MKQEKDQYQILTVTKGKTTQGNNYFSIEVTDKETGEIIMCSYFGNTTPKRVLSIETRVTPNSVYNIATIQPHTSRDKKTGRFISTTKDRKRIKA